MKRKALLYSKLTWVTYVSRAATSELSMAPWVSGMLSSARVWQECGVAHGGRGRKHVSHSARMRFHPQSLQHVTFEVQPQNFVAVKMVMIYRKMSLGCLLYKSLLQLSLNINQNVCSQQNDGFGITFSRQKEMDQNCLGCLLRTDITGIYCWSKINILVFKNRYE